MSANSADVNPCLSGFAFLSTLEAMRTIVGDSTYKRAMASLPTYLVMELDNTNALTWVPIRVADSIANFIAKTAARNADELLDQAVRLGLQRSFSTIWRLLLRLTTDAALIARTPIIYKRVRNVGELSATILSPGTGEVVLSGWPDVPAHHIRTIGVSIQCVVELAGRVDVAIRSTPTTTGAHYLVTWQT